MIPSQVHWVKDLVLPHMWYRSQLWLGFDLWPRKFHMPPRQPNKKQSIVSALLKFSVFGVPLVGTVEMNPTRIHEVVGSIPGLIQWVEDPVLR